MMMLNIFTAQTSYIRPLSKLIYIHNKEKANKDLNDHIVRTKLDVSRPRIKIKTLNVSHLALRFVSIYCNTLLFNRTAKEDARSHTTNLAKL